MKFFVGLVLGATLGWVGGLTRVMVIWPTQRETLIAKFDQGAAAIAAARKGAPAQPLDDDLLKRLEALQGLTAGRIQGGASPRPVKSTPRDRR